MDSSLSTSSYSSTKEYSLPESIKLELSLQILNDMDINSTIRNADSASTENLSSRVSAEEMDEKRHQNIAYEYLCHLEEAKKWIESCIREELPSASEFEENLRNGVYLAKLSNFFCPEKVPFKKIFDRDQSKYGQHGLQFRHTDNINHFYNAMEHIGLPKIFFPETTDIYDKKNMPRVIYCLHALSLYLFKLGIAPQIQDLYGVAKFTDEEITTMAKELKKYGLQLPAFSKIGGILANEMPVDEAALHAAILAINDSIEKKNLETLLVNLKLPDAHLYNIYDEYVKFYHDCMYDAKIQKSTEVAQNKSVDVNYIADVYDELLTQAEIQFYLNQINDHAEHAVSLIVDKLVVEINECINKQNCNLLLRLLKSKASPFKNIFDNYIDWYMAQLTQEKESKLNLQSTLDQETIQNSLNIANLNADNQIKSTKVLELLNKSLINNNKEEFVRLLQKNYQLFTSDQQAQCDESQLDCPYAGSLYYVEFKLIQEEKQSQLDIDDFVHGLKVLCPIVQINKCLENAMLFEPTTNLVNELYSKLSNVNAHLQNIKNTDLLKKRYYESFVLLKQYKNNNNNTNGVTNNNEIVKTNFTSLSDSGHSEISDSSNSSTSSSDTLNCNLLTHGEVQDLILQTNADYEQECLAVVLINESLEKENYSHTLYLLKNSLPHRDDKTIIIDQNSYLYHFQMKNLKNVKKHLDINDIKDEIKNCNIKLENALNMTKTMILLNQIDETECKKNEILNLIRDKSLGIKLNNQSECLDLYFQTYKDLKRICKSQPYVNSEYFWNKTVDDLDFYLNLLNANNYSWTMPISFGPTPNLITRTILKKAIESTTEKYEQNQLYKSRETIILRLQALARGYLLRDSIEKRCQHFLKNQQKIIKIQAWWRGTLTRKAFIKRIEHYTKNTQRIILIQSYVRMWLNRRRYLARIQHFRLNENAIIKIQSLIRSKQARDDYTSLINDQNPSLKVVRKFVYLLEQSNSDFTEELELQELKRQIITAIKMNKNLEQDLDMMDVKIGLLVKNRITLQDVLMQHKKLKKYKEDIELNQTNQIKQLSKENHIKMELYQNLFYLLQTNPIYLSKLLFILPITNTSKFIESVVLQLFNYAANSREEYLLLKLFTSSLQLEIESKVDKMSDIITGTPLVIKVIVSLYRKHRGENILRSLLNQTIEEFLSNKQLQLCLNPSELYKSWINKIESDTGKPSGLPYDITNQKALEHEEIRKKFDENIKLVKYYTSKFLQLIIKSLDKLPYGLRYIAKILRLSLKQKFPTASDREILKIIGNLVYYRFINSAICSPDVYDVIDVKAGGSFDSEQRKNLACIAKHLQLISMSKGYGDTENAHLACLNPFIKESHEQIRSYFNEVCNVCDADEYFGIDEYSDLIVLTKPIVYMTVQEISDTHKILVQYLDKIAPDQNDPLREIFALLQHEPNLDSLTENLTSRQSMGSPSIQESPKQEALTRNSSNLSKNTQLCLTLTNRFTPNSEEKTEQINLFIRTKRLIIELIHCQSGDNLKSILNSPCSLEQELAHQRLVKRREQKNELISGVEQFDLIRKSLSMPLEDIKREVRHNLVELEQCEIVSSANGYQSVISRIGHDIRNQRKYRQRRQKEMAHLKQVFKVLQKKQNLLKEQVSYYNEYVKACLDGFNSKKGTRSKNPFKRKEEKIIGTIKYSAAKLYDKGVILEIEGLNTSQFKNVLFEISTTEEPGTFDVSAKFMGVTMEKVELVFQDLLQMQYEGASIMKMFDKAKINVNLLIFLLNKKFYGK